MCTTGSFTPSGTLTPSPTHANQNLPERASIPDDPFVVGRAPLSESQLIKESALDLLGFGPPGELPNFPSSPTPAPGQSCDAASNEGKGDSDESDDDEKEEDDGKKSVRGRFTNAHRDAVQKAYQEVDKIFIKVSEQTQRPMRNIIAGYTQTHGHIATKSDWNTYQSYFRANMETERARVGDPDASGMYSHRG
jgi:ribosomal protein S17E